MDARVSRHGLAGLVFSTMGHCVHRVFAVFNEGFALVIAPGGVELNIECKTLLDKALQLLKME